MRLTAPKTVFLLLAVTLSLVNAGSPCGVDLCSSEYAELVAGRQAALPVRRRHGNQRNSERQRMERKEVENNEYCGLLHAYHHCMRAISKSCRGNLEYHTVLSLVRQWIGSNNCTASSYKTRQTVKSGTRASSSGNKQQQETRRKQQQEQRKLKLCLRDAFNFTVNREHFLKMKARLRDSDLRSWSRDDRVSYSSESNSQKRRKSKSRLTRHLVDDADEDEDEGDATDEHLKDDEEPSSEKQSTPSKVDATKTTASTVESSTRIESQKVEEEPEESLTCLIYGDPHLRTFDHKYMTCQCIGAWPLIDHPLFAVQITNSKLKVLNTEATGVTKVTVLIREFSSCSLTSDILYEAETIPEQKGSSQPLAATFIEGSSSAANNLVRVESVSSDLVIIHLDHVGAKVIVGKISSSNYLSIVIKFKNNLSSSQRLEVLNALSANSLCREGCPFREQVDVKDILKETGIDVASAAVFDAKASPEVAIAVNEQMPPKDNALSDPCSGLFGYYRISCLYDVKIKGLNEVSADNVHRFAQNYDDMKIMRSTFEDEEKTEVRVEPVTNRGVSICSTVFLVIFVNCIIH